jgi:hypothetical protein
MSESDATIYLSKDDKIFGPYSQTDLQQLKSDGKFSQFIWVCYDLSKGWEPVHPAPALPTPQTAQRTALADLDPPMPGKKILRQNLSSDTVIIALCQARTKIISATLKDIRADGGILTDVHPLNHGVPWFKKGATAQMNLLDSKNAKTQNIEARVSDVLKKDGQWTYAIRWSTIPDIFC